MFFSLVILVMTLAFLGAIVQGGADHKEDVSTGDMFPPAGADLGTSAFSMTGAVAG